MTQRSASSAPSALFLTPEPPVASSGGGGMRSASVLEYLRAHYQVEVASFTVPHHSKSFPARAFRNAVRFARGVPPLFDRFAGFESQLKPVLNGRRYDLGIVEHFWCAPYASLLRPHCDRLVLDLHNIESHLADSHARAATGIESAAFKRFAAAYRRLEAEWLPRYDVILVASEEDRRRVEHPKVRVYPNAIPEVPRLDVPESDCIVFSGNLEYHPNLEAVRWFRRQVWPRLPFSNLEWRIVGRNEHRAAAIVAGDDRITLTGAVPDAIPALAAAKVCIVPLLSGSGTRFKILEAWAAGRAVVSTTIGAEGLGAISGKHLLIADGAESFAAAITTLLKDPAQRAALGESGRALYLDRYTWAQAWKKLHEAVN